MSREPLLTTLSFEQTLEYKNVSSAQYVLNSQMISPDGFELDDLTLERGPGSL
jgi:hypothetical protein